jgi:N-methylhydantoinase B
VETNEMINPILYLFRRESIDSGAPGKWRGGTGISYGFITHNTPGISLGVIGMGRRVSSTSSLDGAYPAGSVRVCAVKGDKLREKLKAGKIPHSIDEVVELVEGEGVSEWPPQHSTEPFESGDFLGIESQVPGAGIGDPLDRDPQKVLLDWRNRIYSLEMARKVFGVVIDPDKKKVDEDATEKEREKIKKMRKERSKLAINP